MATTMKITIRYNRFLDPIFLVYVKTLPKYKDWKPATLRTVLRRTAVYREIWNAKGISLLRKIYKVADLKFKRNLIEIHVVSGNPRPFSNPIVITANYNETKFLLVVLEELLHVLLKDNRVPFIKSRDNLTVRKHVQVFSILLKVLDKETVDYAIENSKPHRDYYRAWLLALKQHNKSVSE
ncbi:MAG: hypothetical protein A2743_02950 [Candidatus Taylorbacteria bacterium RIFCSPHIGHO2_01_FULL_43_47]|nr:MAG: hypothetical protein A2743_02950 [Candidatus Taylorbacteria bacterium RIFCSPHIGHO2_01_FULL_43_47]